MAHQAPAAQRLKKLQPYADQQALQLKKTHPDRDPLAVMGHGNQWPSDMRRLVQDDPQISIDARAQHIFDRGEQQYTEDLARGQAILAELKQRRERRAEDRPAFEQEAREKAQDVNDLYEARYKTTTRPLNDPSQPDDRVYSSVTEGYDDPQAQTTSGKAAYVDQVNMSHNFLQTSEVYAKEDPNRKGSHFLYNSEVFWQQWQEAVAADTRRGPGRDNRTRKKIKKLSAMVQRSISNGATQLTVHHAMRDGSYFFNGYTQTISVQDEEFAAILGTPNGRGIGNMMKDHFHELEKDDFRDVEIDGDTTSFTVNFG